MVLSLVILPVGLELKDTSNTNLTQKLNFCLVTIAIALLGLFFLFSSNSYGIDTDDLRKQINQITQKLTELSQAKRTLKNEIAYIDSQISLTTLQITQTENSIDILKRDIAELSLKISQLDIDLNQLSRAFIIQTTQSYKLQKTLSPLIAFVSGDFNQFLKQQKYLTVVQKNSQDTLVNLETVRTNYDLQKQKKAKKQEELEVLQLQLATQKNNLASQKTSKDHLLTTTQNDEAKYQELLKQAQSELEAIEAIIAGRGTETEVGPITKGNKIAYVIEGKSCNSSGTHLHFMVKREGKVQNPFLFLSNTEHVNESGGDPFNPSGDWAWPLNPTIRLTQGYGNTWAVQNTWVSKIYSFHSGIDIVSTTSNEIFSTQNGTLFRGSYSGGCNLKYIRVENIQDKIETLYLHVNYF